MVLIPECNPTALEREVWSLQRAVDDLEDEVRTLRLVCCIFVPVLMLAAVVGVLWL